MVLDWFRRLRKVTRKLALPSRDATSGRSGVQLNPAKLTPSPDLYLARLSYLMETASEVLSEQSHSAPTERLGKNQLELAAKYAARSKTLDQLLAKLGVDPQVAKDSIAESVEQFHQYTLGRGWYENLIRLHIGYGILEDLYSQLAKGLSPARRVQVESLLADRSLLKFAETTLLAAIKSQPQLAHQLALFARAIVADVLLEVRNSVSLEKVMVSQKPTDKADAAREAFKVLEPLTSELIAGHTQRMDALGLTA